MGWHWEALEYSGMALGGTERQGKAVVGSAGNASRYRQMKAAQGSQARTTSPRHPLASTPPGSPALTQPQTASSAPPPWPHRGPCPHSQQVPRAMVATSSSSRLAASSPAGTRQRRGQFPARDESPWVSPHGPTATHHHPSLAGQPWACCCVQALTWAGCWGHCPQRHVLIGAVVLIRGCGAGGGGGRQGHCKLQVSIDHALGHTLGFSDESDDPCSVTVVSSLGAAKEKCGWFLQKQKFDVR